MDVELIFKIAAVGILVAVLNQLLVRAERDDLALLLCLAGLLGVMGLIVREIAQLFTLIKTLFRF